MRKILITLMLVLTLFTLDACSTVASDEIKAEPLKINDEPEVSEYIKVKKSEKEPEKKTETPKEKKEQEKIYSDEDLEVMAHVIMGEADGCSWEMMEGVGSVVLNRKASKLYPDTIAEVVFQNGQYACTWDGNYDKIPSEQAIEVAKYLLENGSQLPENVIYQAEFKQGSDVYKKIDDTYFCVE